MVPSGDNVDLMVPWIGMTDLLIKNAKTSNMAKQNVKVRAILSATLSQYVIRI